jgi:uncharacterized membrane protein YeaQ/YmgE (transglycosylase-associated protein family)
MNLELLLTGALIGLLATVVMDISSLVGIILGLAGRNPARTGYDLVGRWFLYLLRGRGRHSSILDTPPLPREVPVGVLVHYFIGAFLGAVLLVVLQPFQPLEAVPTLLGAVAFGIATTVFPWFYLHPVWGYGFFGANARGFRMTYFSLYNHTFFGLGLALWTILLYRS